MSIEQHLHSVLRHDIGVSQICGYGDDARIYFLKLPQNGAFPAITITKISGVRGYTFQGPDGWAFPRFQVDCWAKSYADLKNIDGLVRAVCNLLNGYTGTLHNVYIGSLLLMNERDVYEPDAELYRTILEFSVTHN